MFTPLLSRLKKELEMLANDPGPGVSAWSVDDNLKLIEAQIEGPKDSPFALGTFSLSIQIPDRYPFEPPNVRFITPIYHPNIDNDGRICLDTLKMQPQGSWSPSININTLLLTIRLLMASPNSDDGLVPDVTEEYRRNIELWRKKAKEHTITHAVQNPNSKLNSTMEEGSKIVDSSTDHIAAVNASSGESSGDESSEEKEHLENLKKRKYRL